VQIYKFGNHFMNSGGEEKTEASTSGTGNDGVEHSELGKAKEKESTDTVPFYKLFAFADLTDYILMIIGTVSAIGNGICLPLMTVLLGDLINSFGHNQNNTNNVVHVVSKMALKYVYLAAGCGVASFLLEQTIGSIRTVASFTGEKKAVADYNKSLVDAYQSSVNEGLVTGFGLGSTVLIMFSTYALSVWYGAKMILERGYTGGDVITIVSSWMITGERQAARIRSLYLKNILRQDVSFFDKETNTGEVVGRMSGDTVRIQDAMGEKGWLLTLVMLSSIPPMVISGSVMSIMIAKMASHGQTAYAKAATLVEQTIGSIRTVASFTGEKKAVEDYNRSLVDAYNSSVHEGLVAGFGIGSMASPCLSAFAGGRAAAFKMFETINRKPEIDVYETKGKVLNDIHGDIELKDVFFTYPSRPDVEIFSGFSLCIPSGTTAALVGQSGSGKSTDNILYGKDGASMEEIEVAVELANAAKFIDKLPKCNISCLGLIK
ncbi:hypothetical protein M8C21_013049, partial [Ambrosia artemisiifolia]